MSTLTDLLLRYWIPVAVVMSVFWGWRSIILFTTDPVLRLPKDDQDPKFYFYRHRQKKLATFFLAAYQFIFTFVGSFAGWCCLYVLVLRVHARLPNVTELTVGDFVLFIFSLLGLTGHLPQVIYGFVESFREIGKAALKKVGVAS